MKRITLTSLLLASAATLAAPAQAQTVEFPAASPASVVKNKVGLTDIEISYARPSARGRDIFGGLVAYDAVWRTGANEATKLTFSTDVVFGGHAVPAGSYALFTIPGKETWTVILSKGTGQWGSYAYKAEDDQCRVQVKPTTSNEMIETFTIDLGHLRNDSAHLRLAWAHTRVAVPIKTDIVSILVPKIEAAMIAEGENKPYLQAAMFYYEHDLDMTKARDWVEAAALLQPDKPWITYRKGLVLAKMGDKAGAIEAAKAAHAQAQKAGGELGAEYTRLSEQLLAKLQ